MSDMIKIRDLIDFLVHREESSAGIFLLMAQRSNDFYLKEWFHEFYLGALRRKNCLLEFKKADGRGLAKPVPLASVRQYLVDIQLKDCFSDSQGLAISILRAETSGQLYARMQSLVETGAARAFFCHLREEVEAHRTRCNQLHDRAVEAENSGESSERL
ncbi:MAG: hypothetical protein ACP5M0_07085 [Desulfomonilaceae bacterium]